MRLLFLDEELTVLKKQEDPRKHHYVPKFYLKKFADSDGYLWTYDRVKHRLFKVLPKTLLRKRPLHHRP